MSDLILLEPQQAGETLLEMQMTLRIYLARIEMAGECVREVSLITFSQPIEDALQALAAALSDIGFATNEAVDSYSQAFVQVIETWRQIDATAAAAVSFFKPGFEGVYVITNSPEKVQVFPEKIRHLIEVLQDCRYQLRQRFQQMSDEINRSATYWIGQSGDLTRQAWFAHVAPLSEGVDALMGTMIARLEQELEAFLRRDAENHVS